LDENSPASAGLFLCGSASGVTHRARCPRHPHHACI